LSQEINKENKGKQSKKKVIKDNKSISKVFWKNIERIKEVKRKFM
jgi:hypothetical protein